MNYQICVLLQSRVKKSTHIHTHTHTHTHTQTATHSNCYTYKLLHFYCIRFAVIHIFDTISLQHFKLSAFNLSTLVNNLQSSHFPIMHFKDFASQIAIGINASLVDNTTSLPLMRSKWLHIFLKYSQ